MSISDIIFILLVTGLFLASFMRDRSKTGFALRVTKKTFENQLPVFTAVFLLIGLFEAFLTKDMIRALLGGSSGLASTLKGTIIGGIATGPPAVAFPVADYLWNAGASKAAVAAFVVAWVSVGTVTLPMEIAYFGRRFALTRWSFSIGASLVIGLIMGAVL